MNVLMSFLSVACVYATPLIVAGIIKLFSFLLRLVVRLVAICIYRLIELIDWLEKKVSK